MTPEQALAVIEQERLDVLAEGATEAECQDIAAYVLASAYRRLMRSETPLMSNGNEPNDKSTLHWRDKNDPNGNSALHLRCDKQEQLTAEDWRDLYLQSQQEKLALQDRIGEIQRELAEANRDVVNLHESLRQAALREDLAPPHGGTVNLPITDKYLALLMEIEENGLLGAHGMTSEEMGTLREALRMASTQPPSPSLRSALMWFVDHPDECPGDHPLKLAAAREALAGTVTPSSTATNEQPPLFGDPDSLLGFLEQAGKGCVSGHITEWPQFKPACRWAAQEIKSMRSATASNEGYPGIAHDIESMREALVEIAKGEGEFSRDRLEHATNTIESMKRIARRALNSAAESKVRNDASRS